MFTLDMDRKHYQNLLWLTTSILVHLHFCNKGYYENRVWLSSIETTMSTCHAQVTRFGIPLFDCTMCSITMSLYDTLCEVFLKKKNM